MVYSLLIKDLCTQGNIQPERKITKPPSQWQKYPSLICNHSPPICRFFFLIDNKSFIEEKEQCVYDCKLIALETNTIKSKREPNREKEIRQ